MYIGSTDLRGLHHLVVELVDNSIDEALAGWCDTDQGGRSTPTNPCRCSTTGAASRSACIRPPNGRRSRSCSPRCTPDGKFGGGGYKVSGGLHGVGLSVVNALSERLLVEVYLDGEVHHQDVHARRARRGCRGDRHDQPPWHVCPLLAGPRDLPGDRLLLGRSSRTPCAATRSSTRASRFSSRTSATTPRTRSISRAGSSPSCVTSTPTAMSSTSSRCTWSGRSTATSSRSRCSIRTPSSRSTCWRSPTTCTPRRVARMSPVSAPR